MKLRFPSLAENSCLAFVTCGMVKTDDKSILKHLANQSGWMVTQTAIAGKKYFLRAGLGGSTQPRNHCHLELAVPEFFPKGRKPEITCSKQDIDKVLDPLEGSSIHVDADGLFALQSSSLPPIVQTAANLLASEQGGVSIMMSGGRIAIRGAPVYAISWTLPDGESKQSSVRIEGIIETNIKDNYVIELFDMINSAFQSFVKSGVPNVNK